MVLLLPSYTAEIKKGRAHRDFVNSLLLSSQFRCLANAQSERNTPSTNKPSTPGNALVVSSYIAELSF